MTDRSDLVNYRMSGCLKKFGLMNLSIAPIIPSIANPIATFVILSLPDFASPDAHWTPPTTIIMKPTSNITVTSILDIALIMDGNALSAAVSFVDQSLFARQLPMNGILVLSGIPTPIPLHLSPYLHEQ